MKMEVEGTFEFDVDVYKKKVPVVDYEDIENYIEKNVNGDTSKILLAQPILEFIRRYCLLYSPRKNISFSFFFFFDLFEVAGLFVHLTFFYFKLHGCSSATSGGRHNSRRSGQEDNL